MSQLRDPASGRSVAVLGIVVLLLLGVAVAASLVSAWRATRVSPGVSLRVE